MFADDEVVIYHNPRCSKSRATLELLKTRGIQPRVLEYLKNPPSPEELEEILSRLGVEPRDIMRRKETEYLQAGFDDPALEREELVRRLHRHPAVLERPIVVANGKAALGRPPENVLAIV
jgi:arsenate reductase